MASPGPEQSLHWQIESQPDRKVTGGGGRHDPTAPSITAPLWKPVMIEISNETGEKDEEKKLLVGNQDSFPNSRKMRRRGEKKHQLDTKSVEQNKRRVQEMTSHSPLFPLRPQVVQENSEWMSRHHGVCAYTMLTTAEAESLHRHDVLDKGCRWRPGQHTERTEEGEHEWVRRRIIQLYMNI